MTGARNLESQVKAAVRKLKKVAFDILNTGVTERTKKLKLLQDIISMAN
jgi:hypothetical protein